MVFELIHMTFWKRQNHSKRTDWWFPGGGGGAGYKGATPGEFLDRTELYFVSEGGYTTDVSVKTHATIHIKGCISLSVIIPH